MTEGSILRFGLICVIILVVVPTAIVLWGRGGEGAETTRRHAICGLETRVVETCRRRCTDRRYEVQRFKCSEEACAWYTLHSVKEWQWQQALNICEEGGEMRLLRGDKE